MDGVARCPPLDIFFTANGDDGLDDTGACVGVPDREPPPVTTRWAGTAGDAVMKQHIHSQAQR